MNKIHWYHRLVLIGVGVMLLLTGCQTSSDEKVLFDVIEEQRAMEIPEEETEETHTLILTHSAATSSKTQRIAQRFAALVEEKLNGRFCVSIYPNDSLGNYTQTTTALQNGAVDVRIGTINSDTLNVISWMPSLLELSLDEANTLLQQGEIREQVEEECLANGTVLAAVFYPSERVFTSNIRITEPDDFKKVRMRVFVSNAIEQEYWESLGASTQNLLINQLIYALRNDTVNSQENTFSIIVSYGMEKEQRYWYDIQRKNYYDALLYSLPFYESLSEEDRMLFDEIAEEITVYTQELEEQEMIYLQNVLEASNMQKVDLSEELQEWIYETTRVSLQKNLKRDYGEAFVDELLQQVSEYIQ